MTATATRIEGVHHSARPTWKLKETVEFYRDILGLPVLHAISAKGWGPGDHPDFIHLFFDSGHDSTIAFFYYLGNAPIADDAKLAPWLLNSVHTAWRVDSREQLLAWKTRLEARGLEVLQVRHEIIESIYVTDPNGYAVEFTWQVRDLLVQDKLDAELTLEAAIAAEAELGGPVHDIETVWRKKAQLVSAHLRRAA